MFQKLLIFSLLNIALAYSDWRFNLNYTEPVIRVCKKPSDGPTYIKFSSESIDEIDIASTRYDVAYGKPCLTKYAVERESWLFGRLGRLLLNESERLFNISEYCYDTDYKLPFVCFGFDFDVAFRAMYQVQGILQLISLPFSITMILVCLFTPAFKNTHGRCLASLTFWLAILELSQALYKLFWIENCGFLGYIIHFSAMSFFCWLCIISYDNFITIKTGESINFLKLNLYAYGISTVMLVITLIFQLTDWASAKYKPGLGEDTCFLKNSSFSRFIYFYCVVLILSVVNIVYSAKSKKLIDAKKEGDEEVPKNVIHQYYLCLSIFILTGITWVLNELLDWFYWDVVELVTFFNICNVINCLHGVWIFVMMLFVKDFRDGVQRLCCCSGGTKEDADKVEANGN